MFANWTAKHAAIGLAIFGYLEAATFYWRWKVIPHEVALVCPLCPHMDSVGTKWEKFSGRTLGLGTLNALFRLLGSY